MTNLMASVNIAIIQSMFKSTLFIKQYCYTRPILKTYIKYKQICSYKVCKTLIQTKIKFLLLNVIYF